MQRGGTTSKRCPSRVWAQSTKLKLARFTPFSTCKAQKTPVSYAPVLLPF